jgi:hypothetical protein
MDDAVAQGLEQRFLSLYADQWLLQAVTLWANPCWRTRPCTRGTWRRK